LSKSIQIIAHYCGDLDGRLSNRFMYLADILSRDYEVELITSDFYHTKKRKKEVTGSYKFKITIIEEPGYSKNIGFKRLYSHWLFGKNLKKYLFNQKKAHLIYCSFPSISLVEASLKRAETTEIPVLIDVQDLWPEAFSRVLNKIPIIGRLVYNFLKRKTGLLFEKASSIVTVSDSYRFEIEKRISEKNFQVTYIGASWKKITTELVVNNRALSSPVNMVYLGSLGDSYDLELVIDAFARANTEISQQPIELYIIGDGEKKAALKKRSEDLGLTVHFLGLLSHIKVQEILPTMDFAINPIVPWSSASIINKHADYAMAGLPVINTQKNKEYQGLLTSYECGINIAHEKGEMVKAIVNLALNSEMRSNMALNSLIMAKEKFDRQYSYEHLKNHIAKFLT
jgi:glycosyltransferase involved in cell wall biosynthesis